MENIPGIGPRAIRNRLQEEEVRLQRQGKPTSKPPSERTISRITEKQIMRPPPERAQYRFFSWPESMEQNILPWEVSALALEVLYLLDAQKFEGRPPVRLVEWYWRVSQAAPDAHPLTRLHLARLLVMRDASGDSGPPDECRSVEWGLAYAPWRP